ncbi:MAG: methyltransferase [Chloroflexi bacterium]|nr:MAG: methyltransferase [Chloroflexota bacterium]
MPISFNERVYALVRHIPPGKVLSYGRVGQLLGMPHGAREVGWAMGVLRDDTVPWHRVVNAQGRVSIKGKPEAAALQRARLEAEGITLDKYDRLDMEQHLWDPAPPEVEQIMQKARGQDAEPG